MANSSMRTAFIRVSKINNVTIDDKETQVVYNYDLIKSILNDWLESTYFTYFLICHNSATDNEHYHIVIKFNNPTPFNNVKSKFPYGNIQPAKNLRSAVQYLIHLNDYDKKKYDWLDIVTNCTDMSKYKVKSNDNEKIELSVYLEKIDNGFILDYNLYNEIPITIYSKYKSQINNALQFYKDRIVMDKNRNIDVLFFTGDSGTGKTSFAKKYCDEHNLSYCISSTSNDVLQDYKGEDVLILDDMRDDSFSFADLLKVLDNHTHSSVKSRYSNKFFIGSKIIITSFDDLSEWYSYLDNHEKRQLYRRISSKFIFDNEFINIYCYNDVTFEYMHVSRVINPIPNVFDRLKTDTITMLEDMGLVEPVQDLEF